MPRLLLEFLGVVVCTRPLKLRPGKVVAGGDVVVATAALLTMAYSVLSSALWLCCCNGKDLIRFDKPQTAFVA